MDRFNLKQILFIMSGVVVWTTGCNNVQFATTNPSQSLGFVNEKQVAAITLPYGPTAEQFTQDIFDKNTITLQFQVSDLRGNVAGVSTADLVIKENGEIVSGVSLTANAENLGRRADIVFVIDDTGSMQPYIDSLKLKVTQFVQSLKETNINASLCLVTFGDEVHKVCSGFVEDDPITGENENLLAFLDELSRVVAFGGADTAENQLLALKVAATGTPWHANAQRIAVLMTDAPFHYAPEYLGNAPSAPTYEDALNSVVAAKMMTFAVAPDVVGYNGDFSHLSSIPQASSGGWYNFDDIINGIQELGGIFNSIVDRLSVIYVAKYIVDDQPRLDPTLPLTARDIRITPTNLGQNWQIQIVNVASSMPMGRPNYKRQFGLMTTSIALPSVSVSVNRAFTPDYAIVGQNLEFSAPPAPGAVVRITYLKGHLRENVRVVPIAFASAESFSSFRVFGNRALLAPTEFVVRQVDALNYLVELNESLFDDSDPFNIAPNSGLEIQVFAR